MILRRLGNKSKIAKEIQSYFPPHKIYYEPFFGAGGMFFNKPRAKYSIVNDIDSDVFNLFQVVKSNMIEFIQAWENTPLSEELFNWWIENEESDPIYKAVRFLFISSFSYLGKANTFRLLHSDTTHKEKLKSLILQCSLNLKSVLFRNVDFRDFFKGINDDDAHIGKEYRFAYLDGPYLGRTNNYNLSKWTEKDVWTEEDVVDLFNTAEESELKFAYSEFDHPFILDQAKTRGLNIIHIGERRNLGSRCNEILMTNYITQPTLF